MKDIVQWIIIILLFLFLIELAKQVWNEFLAFKHKWNTRPR